MEERRRAKLFFLCMCTCLQSCARLQQTKMSLVNQSFTKERHIFKKVISYKTFCRQLSIFIPSLSFPQPSAFPVLLRSVYGVRARSGKKVYAYRMKRRFTDPPRFSSSPSNLHKTALPPLFPFSPPLLIRISEGKMRTKKRGPGETPLGIRRKCKGAVRPGDKLQRGPFLARGEGDSVRRGGCMSEEEVDTRMSCGAV